MKDRRTCVLWTLLALAIFLVDGTRCLGQTDPPRWITAASNMLHPPFSSWDEKRRAVGIEVDIVQSAAEKLGHKVKWIEMPFGELLDATHQGKVDVAVSTIGITDKRRDQVAFSQPYYQTQIVALVSMDSKYTNLEELKGKTIGADRTTTSFLAARKQWPDNQILGEKPADKSWPDCVQEGKIDAFVVDASDQQRLESISKIKLRRIGAALSNEQFAVAVGLENQKLLSAINESILSIRPTVPLRVGNEYQFTTPLGRAIHSLASPRQKLVDDYLTARAEWHLDSENAEKTIWYGRRAGYLLRLNEAIEIFSWGIKTHPSDARFYRHRGHRYISTRQFDKAIADFEMAVRLIEGQKDSVEPDGAPNPQGIQLTTLHGNIWYHLGLAYYLKNDMKNARRAYSYRQNVHRNDDNIVSSGHWLYMILRRLDEKEAAAKLVSGVHKDMTIIENMRYHQMCLFYAGKIDEKELQVLRLKDYSDDVIWYGLGNYNLYEKKDVELAKQKYQRLLKDGSPVSFAFIAAESDYRRLFGQDK